MTIKTGVKTWMFGYSKTLPSYKRGGEAHWQKAAADGRHSQIVERLGPCWNCDMTT